jgi:hypothetical protein
LANGVSFAGAGAGAVEELHAGRAARARRRIQDAVVFDIVNVSTAGKILKFPVPTAA